MSMYDRGHQSVRSARVRLGFDMCFGVAYIRVELDESEEAQDNPRLSRTEY